MIKTTKINPKHTEVAVNGWGYRFDKDTMSADVTVESLARLLGRRPDRLRRQLGWTGYVPLDVAAFFVARERPKTGERLVGLLMFRADAGRAHVFGEQLGQVQRVVNAALVASADASALAEKAMAIGEEAVGQAKEAREMLDRILEDELEDAREEDAEILNPPAFRRRRKPSEPN